MIVNENILRFQSACKIFNNQIKQKAIPMGKETNQRYIVETYHI